MFALKDAVIVFSELTIELVVRVVGTNVDEAKNEKFLFRLFFL